MSLKHHPVKICGKAHSWCAVCRPDVLAAFVGMRRGATDPSVWKRPGYREKMIIAHKLLWQDSNYRENRRTAVLVAWQNQERLEKARVRAKQQWARPGYAEQQTFILPIGTERADSDGRVFVKCANGWQRRSRLVMEKILGRVLCPNERVHHKDTNPGNDDPNNLQLMPNCGEHTRLHHKGKITPLEVRAKMSSAAIGRHHTIETRAKLSAIHKGKYYGKRKVEQD